MLRIQSLIALNLAIFATGCSGADTPTDPSESEGALVNNVTDSAPCVLTEAYLKNAWISGNAMIQAQWAVPAAKGRGGLEAYDSLTGEKKQEVLWSLHSNASPIRDAPRPGETVERSRGLRSHSLTGFSRSVPPTPKKSASFTTVSETIHRSSDPHC